MNSLIRLSLASLIIVSFFSLLMVLFFPINIMMNNSQTQVDIRTKPHSYRGEAFGLIKPTESVTCFGKKGEWAKTIHLKKTGFVNLTLLSAKIISFGDYSIGLDLIIKITSGLVFIISFFILLQMKGRKNDHSISQSLRVEASDRTNKNSFTSDSTSILESIEFDKFIQNKFNSNRHFRLMEWIGDEDHRTIFSKINMRPILKYEFNVGQFIYELTVECKWYKKYDDDINGIKWSENEQFDAFQQYQKNNNIPVFVIIGLGGWAYQPKYLFIVPFNKMKSPSVSMNLLYQYKNNPNKLIHFDYKVGRLSTL
jgi:hypothetical protein